MAGFEAKLNVVFVATPVFRDVILVDRTSPKDRLDALIQAAKAMVAEAKDNVRYAIVAYPSATNGLVLGATAATIEGKQLTQALDGLTPDATGVFDTTAAFAGASQLIKGERVVGDLGTIHFLTGTEAVVPAQAVADTRAARVAVNPLGLTGASPEAKPEHLVHNAILGTHDWRVMLGVKQPRVGLMTIGTEEGKGNFRAGLSPCSFFSGKLDRSRRHKRRCP